MTGKTVAHVIQKDNAQAGREVRTNMARAKPKPNPKNRKKNPKPKPGGNRKPKNTGGDGK